MPWGFSPKTQRIEEPAACILVCLPLLFMACQPKRPHFLLFPVMAQGHMIPMVDIAKLLAQRGAIITLVTTPQNASRFQTFLDRATESGLQIRTVQLQFPCEEAGLPKGCENFDLLPSLSLIPKFLNLTSRLHPAAEKLFEDLTPRPSCIISDMALHWTIHIAHKYKVPRIVFYSLSCYYLLCMGNLLAFNVGNTEASESEHVIVANFPHRVEFSKSQLNFTSDPEFIEWCAAMAKADFDSYGFIVNTYYELEPDYIEAYKKTKGSGKVWCVGPACLCNKDTPDKAQRGDKAAIDEYECLRWLDRQEPCSVVYTALGSLCNVILAQIIELGLGLEASNRPFIWVIRQTSITEELEKWLSEYGYEEKTKGRGLVIRGWAPQVLLLSHPAIGGFITHCGWNSTIEGISAGVPMVTWPLFADQGFNEKLIVQVLKIGVSLGVEKCVRWGVEEEVGVLVKKEAIRDAVQSLMDGEEKDDMRRRVRELAERAKRAMEEEGSSHLNMTLLIEDIIHQHDSDTA